MSYRVYLLMLLFVIGFYACSPNPKSGNGDSDLANKSSNGEANGPSFLIVDSLKKLFAIADTLQPMYGENDTTDRVSKLNFTIGATLATILRDPQLTRQNLKALLRSSGLNIVHSDDKKLWLFNWYENTGGSFKSNISMVHYLTSSGKPMAAYDDILGTAEGEVFPSAGAWFDKIYKLRSDRELYLCIGSGIGCNTCIFQTAVVVELQKDKANFNYDAFDEPGDKAVSYGENNSSCFTLGARVDDIEEFTFDPKTQTLTVIYLTDDLTPIPRVEEEKQKRIVRKLVFNGMRFVGTAFE